MAIQHSSDSLICPILSPVDLLSAIIFVIVLLLYLFQVTGIAFYVGVVGIFLLLVSI